MIPHPTNDNIFVKMIKTLDILEKYFVIQTSDNKSV